LFCVSEFFVDAVGRNMASKQEVLEQMVAPIVAALDCELWGLEYLTQGRYTTVRIYIDSPQGVTLDDCEKISRQISSIFDVEDPISSEYTLEVSSPGIDRPLYKESQYLAYVGQEINARLRVAVEGRRRFKGVITKVENGQIVLQVDGKEVVLAIDAIDKANIEPCYDEILRERGLNNTNSSSEDKKEVSDE
jgi:ribosome maturation factor RimP